MLFRMACLLAYKIEKDNRTNILKGCEHYKMLVKDLIAQLRDLPKNSTIGSLDLVEGTTIIKSICITDSNKRVYVGDRDYITIKQIEARQWDQDSICDYYIV